MDALCKRFFVDNSNRTLHGALLDSEILAEVYLELVGGKEPDLELCWIQAPKVSSCPHASKYAVSLVAAPIPQAFFLISPNFLASMIFAGRSCGSGGRVRPLSGGL